MGPKLIFNNSVMKILGVVICFIFAISRTYCTKKCDKSESKFWQGVLGDDYLQGPNLAGGVNETDEFAKCILGRHNYYRESVGLNPLKWNKTIADIAFETSTYILNNASCDESHRMKFNERHWLGENLFAFGRFPALSESDLDMCENGKKATDDFYREIRNYIYPVEDVPFHKCVNLTDMRSKYGHFVQMMWSEASQLGCSYASCIGCNKGIDVPKIIINCYYNAPILKGARVFDNQVAERLNEWEENKQYGGFKNCSVAEKMTGIYATKAENSSFFNFRTSTMDPEVVSDDFAAIRSDPEQ